MAPKCSLLELDAYLADLAQAAGVLAGVTLSRRVARSVLQAKLRTAIARGEAPKTLAELQAFVEGHRTRWKLSRRGLKPAAPAAPAPRARAERSFPPDQVSREVGVPPETIVAWCRRGWLRSDGAAEPRVPDSALHAFRAAQARWKRLISVGAAAREDAPEPGEAEIFAAIAARGAK
jgi:hypothetical protein